MSKRVYGNTDRARKAWTALNGYSPAIEQDAAVSDLLADLIHLVDGQRLAAAYSDTATMWPSFEELVDRAKDNAMEETREDGTAGFPGRLA